MKSSTPLIAQRSSPWFCGLSSTFAISIIVLQQSFPPAVWSAQSDPMPGRCRTLGLFAGTYYVLSWHRLHGDWRRHIRNGKSSHANGSAGSRRSLGVFIAGFSDLFVKSTPAWDGYRQVNSCMRWIAQATEQGFKPCQAGYIRRGLIRWC